MRLPTTRVKQLEKVTSASGIRHARPRLKWMIGETVQRTIVGGQRHFEPPAGTDTTPPAASPTTMSTIMQVS